MDSVQIGVLLEWVKELTQSGMRLSEREEEIAASLVRAILERREEDMYVGLGERWKETGHEGYAVSSMGRVRSHWKRNGRAGGKSIRGLPKILKATRNSVGYRQVRLYRDGQPTSYTVHKLVALAFLGSRPDGLVIHHRDGNRLNNQAANLQYVTDTENRREGWRHKRKMERQLSGQTAFLEI